MDSIQQIAEARNKLSILKATFLDNKPGGDFKTMAAFEKVAQACGLLENAMLDEINFCIEERKKRATAVQPHNKKR